MNSSERLRARQSRKSASQEDSSSLFIVANRLPVTLRREADGSWSCTKSSGGLVSGLMGVKEVNMVWVGWPGCEIPVSEHEAIRSLLAQRQCIPVFLTEEQIRLYYNGYANNVLWPLFHYVTPPDYAETQAEWDAYGQVNRLFAEVVSLVLKVRSDYVWVHDYHLMLFPAQLRALVPDVRVGWFLHTPFPSPEYFRMSPQREELLQGLLAANLVGFHIHDYARHFLSSVGQLTSLEISPHGVLLPGRKVTTATLPIGIDPRPFQQTSLVPETAERVSVLREQWGDRKVILGVDRLDYMKGIPHKLQAFDVFLATHPEWASRCVLVQLAVPSRGDVVEYQRLKRQVHELVGSICGRHSTLHTGPPVIYLDRAIGHEELTALYRAADVALITSLRDGMNLVAYEFVASQTNKHGVLVLSEFAGASQTLGAGALRINPWDLESTAEAVHEALTMSDEERRNRWQFNWDYVCTHTAQKWAQTFVETLKEVCVSIPPDGHGEHSQLALSKELDQTALLQRFAAQQQDQSERWLLVLDLVDCLVSSVGKGGVPVTLHHSMLRVPVPLREALRTLSAVCDIVIVSSHSDLLLSRFLGDLRVATVTESGTKARFPPDERAASFGEFPNKERVKNLMKYFMDRTPGSYLEETDHTLKLFFDNTPGDFAPAQMRDLVLHLYAGPLANSEADLVATKRYVEVRPHGVSIGRTLRTALLQRSQIYQACLAVTALTHKDEDFYQEISDTPAIAENALISVSVGDQETKAKFFLPCVSAVQQLLIRLASSVQNFRAQCSSCVLNISSNSELLFKKFFIFLNQGRKSIRIHTI